MKAKRLFLTTLLAGVALVFTACKKDDTQPSFLYKSQGFVKGTLTGSSSDNSYTFNDAFNYSQYNREFVYASTYTINTGGSYSVEIGRADFNGDGSIKIDFVLNSATDTAPHNIDISFFYTKELNDKFVTFSMNSSVNNTTTITELTFDATTGRMTGKFSLTGSDNSSGKNASVTGSFDVIVKKEVA